MGAVKNIPILVNGGLDTKSNPKLVKPGSALQLDNLYQLRAGELRVRNGVTTQTANASIASAGALYAQGGGVSAIAGGLSSGGPHVVPVRYGKDRFAVSGWEYANGSNGGISAYPYPKFTCRTDALIGDWVDYFDGDIGTVGNLQAATSYSGSFPAYKTFDVTTGRPVDTGAVTPTSTRPMIVCPTANNLPIFYVNTSTAPYSIGMFGTGAGHVPLVINSLLTVATPWFDVIRGPVTTDTVVIAYSASAGGVSIAVVDVTTGTVTLGPTRFGTLDASMCLGWLNSTIRFATAVTLAIAGSTNGVTSPAFGVSGSITSLGTDVIDATATANVRQITGHYESVSTYNVLWDVASASGRIYDLVKRGRNISGTTTVTTLAPSFSLYSRTAKGADGRWYFVGAYESPVQSSYSLLTVDSYVSAAAATNRSAQMCQVMAGDGGGRRTVPASLTTLQLSGSTLIAALPRKRKVTVAGVSAAQGRIIQRATFTDVSTTMSRPRELGGAMYLPGGVIQDDDGQSCRAACFPRYPEAVVTAVSFNNGGGGFMTPSKTYGYRLILKRQDGNGRAVRSAGSLPVTVTLGAGDNAVALTMVNPSLPVGDPGMFWLMEIYRVGPIESGATLYNKVATASYDGTSTTTIAINEVMSDANAALQEAAYFTGNVEENFAPPSSGLLEVNGGRIWLVNAEDPTELWPSKQSKTGVVPGFTSDFAFRVDGDGQGAITALGSMDGRLVAFKDTAIWVISGDGPNDNGQGTFNPPQNISHEVGVPAGLARSIVNTPDGLMFQSGKGIYLLSRGLSLEYIGAPVEQYTLAESAADASAVHGTTQIRWVMPSGRCLVWDYYFKTWATSLLPVGGSSVVACCDLATGWAYVTANGVLRYEVAGATTDDGVAIIPTISLPHLNFAGLANYQRLKGLDIVVDVVGNHTISVDAEFDYSGALTGTPKTKALTTATPTFIVEYLPPEGKAKCTAMRPVITVTGAPLNGTFRLTSITAWYMVKRGSNTPATSRLT